MGDFLCDLLSQLNCHHAVLKRASLAAAIGIPTVTTAAEVVSGRFGFVTNKVRQTIY